MNYEHIVHGNSIDVLKEVPDNHFDAIITDPPYGLVSINKRFGKKDAKGVKHDVFANTARGFMGKAWDGTGIEYNIAFWSECLRVLKPGGHLVAFGGTRTHHRIWCAIEDAGFEIRDTLMWLFASGFPKSHSVAKKLDGGEAAQFDGFGTALKPAYEPIVLARKPLSEKNVVANVLKWSTGAINIDASRVPAVDQAKLEKQWDREFTTDIRGGNFMDGKPGQMPLTSMPGNGRWPANVVTDGSDAVLAHLPTTKTVYTVGKKAQSGYGREWDQEAQDYACFPDEGSAARFFFTAKASRAEREMGLSGDEKPYEPRDNGFSDKISDTTKARANHHPCVKPLALMRWLIRIVTPPGGVILDPFCGSGSTLVAAKQEGVVAVGIEMEESYVEIARKRLAAVGAEVVPVKQKRRA